MADKIREQMSTADERDSLTRRGFRLEYASMAWMTVEAAVGIAAGIVASSIALIAFGLDSVVEFPPVPLSSGSSVAAAASASTGQCASSG